MKRFIRIAAAVLIVALAIGLYKAKTEAAAARAHVRELQSQIEAARADLNALRAEIAHLETPERVEALAETHLGLAPARGALPETAIRKELPAPQEGER